MTNLHNLVETRNSIRRYTPNRPVAPEKLEKRLKNAGVSPSW